MDECKNTTNGYFELKMLCVFLGAVALMIGPAIYNSYAIERNFNNKEISASSYDDIETILKHKPELDVLVNEAMADGLINNKEFIVIGQKFNNIVTQEKRVGISEMIE